jgi:hypothetical protein
VAEYAEPFVAAGSVVPVCQEGVGGGGGAKFALITWLALALPIMLALTEAVAVCDDDVAVKLPLASVID